jgi:RND superfamily putative drug exporter
VLFDAFVIRLVLVPALMHLFGRASWWMPRAVDRRLPRLSIEGPQAAPQES